MAKTTTPANDLVFKELIKRGYSLDGNTRIWDLGDSKLWYLRPTQAQGYLDLIKTRNYQKRYTDKEDELVNQKMEEILKLVGENPINLVDLGCGDGMRALEFIKQISKKTKIRYCPVDISSYMVNKAIKNISNTGGVKEVIEFQWNISDFDNTENILNILKNTEYKKNVILFLGGTLGNTEFHDLIYQVHTGMKHDDLLIIGNFLKNENTSKELGTEVQKEHADWLVKVPELLGINKEDVTVKRRIKNGRSEIYFTLQEDYNVKFGNKEVRFFKGDQIIVLVGYLYFKKIYKEFLDIYFDSVDLAVYPDETYSLALCKK